MGVGIWAEETCEVEKVKVLLRNRPAWMDCLPRMSKVMSGPELQQSQPSLGPGP